MWCLSAVTMNGVRLGFPQPLGFLFDGRLTVHHVIFMDQMHERSVIHIIKPERLI